MKLSALQEAFTTYLRNPSQVPALDGAAPERLAVYAELVYHNVDALLTGSFPVLCRVMPNSRWRALVRDFLTTHRAQTPLFSRLPCEFLSYLQSAGAIAKEPMFLRELALYEWLELEASYDERELADYAIDENDLLRGIPVLNPTARPQAFWYPVHRIAPDFLPDAPLPAPLYLVVFRARDDSVRFMELTPATAKLLELILHNSREENGEQLLGELARQLAHPDPAALLAQGRAMLQELETRELLLGARSP